jgi:hypothetical protein
LPGRQEVVGSNPIFSTINNRISSVLGYYGFLF